MSKDSFEFGIKCPKCGSVMEGYPSGTKDTDMVVCDKCGADIAPLGKLRKAAMAVAKKQSASTAQKMAKNFGKRR